MEKVQLSNVEKELITIMLKHNVSPDSALWKDVAGLVDVLKEEQRKIDIIKSKVAEIASVL